MESLKQRVSGGRAVAPGRGVGGCARSAGRGGALHGVRRRREGRRVQAQARPDEPQGRRQAPVVRHQAARNAELIC